MTIQIRGIYTTALTAHLHDQYTVVLPSPPIRDRFSTEFSQALPDVTIHSTSDRQGIEVTGDPGHVDELTEHLTSVGRDTFIWPNPAPRGAVFTGVVTETLGSGAVVDLGSRPAAERDQTDTSTLEGFLPYDRVEEYVDVGDEYRLQVAGSEPPWSASRPSLATDLRVPGGIVELRRNGDGQRDETARMAELLPVDPPAGWIPHWDREARDVSLDVLADALERVSDRADSLMSAVASTDTTPPGRIIAPQSGAWVWFGRETRFTLDSYRREIMTTMPGHHRVKAAADAANAAVDFVETYCEPTGDFPFDVVTRQFGPHVGDHIDIIHGKPSGNAIRLGRGEVTEREADGSITVERQIRGGGTYDALNVPREAGDAATTTFVEGRWWYATVYTSADGERRGTYINVCTPVEIYPHASRYVDLHVDVVKTAAGEVRRVDDDELNQAVAADQMTGDLAERAREVATSIVSALQ